MGNAKPYILFVTQNFYPESFGINDIVSDMTQRGFRVDVLTGLPNYPIGRFFDGYGLFKRGDKYYGGARLYRCAVFPRLKNSKIGISLNYATFAFFASLKLIRLLFKKYDKIFVYEPSPLFQAIPGLIAAKLKRCEKIIYVLDIWPDSVYSVVDMKNAFARKLLKNYSERTYRKFDRLLVTSKGFIPQLEKAGVKREKITYLPQWTPPYVKDGNAKPELEGTFNVVFTGNVGIPQDLGILTGAAALVSDLSDVRFIIVGDGDYLGDLKRKAAGEGVQSMFVFEGRKPYQQMPGYYESAGCLVASLKDIELFSKTVPAKIQAYMQAGKPILCAINGESARLVEEAGCGLCSPAGETKALAENIKKLYAMPESQREKMGRRGREYAEKHFGRQELLSRLAEILSRPPFDVI